jgi:FKBP-type peptidyl-prolyl cis-trans isomerase
VVGTVHRVVSKDGKTLTVHNKGTHADGKAFDDTLVFDKQ